MSELPDFNPDVLRAQLDQIASLLRDFAPAVALFWTSLMTEGMSEGAATVVVAQWVTTVLTKGNQK